jgi:hypothetical protein
MKELGMQSNNPTLECLALTAALDKGAHIPLGDKYVDDDAWLTYTAFRLSNAISGACRAVIR